jgi:hypothetical protein
MRQDLTKSYIRRSTHKNGMAAEAYRKKEAEIAFSPPMPLTSAFYQKTSTENLKEAANILLNTLHDSFGAKETPMDKALSRILKHPDKVRDAQAIFGVEPSNSRGEAVYSVKITTDRETAIFSLRVSKDSTELSYFKNGGLVERHYQQGSEIVHEVPKRGD